MKISYKNYPSIKFIENKKLPDIYGIELNEFFSNNLSNPNNEFYFVSKPFYESFFNNSEKLYDHFIELLKTEKMDLNIFNGYFLIGNKLTSFIENKGSLFFIEFIKDKVSCYNIQKGYFVHPSIFPKIVDRSKIIESKYKTLLLLSFFIKYAQIETKYLKSNNKTIIGNSKYLNSLNIDIKYLNSTWFTNLVKSDEFKVKGHFRLQPCGKGLQERKLIWINDFKKKGYKRKAGKLKL